MVRTAGMVSLSRRGPAVPIAHVELKVLALQSPQIVLNEVAQDFQSRTLHRIVQLAPLIEMPAHIERRIARGVQFDLAFLTPPMLDALSMAGHILPATRTRFMKVPIGIAVRAGSARPDISTIDTFKRTVLNARSIAYLKAGVSGPHLQYLFETFGISGEIEAKSFRPETDNVGELVAKGHAEIGITAISTLMATSGIDVVGTIPKELQTYVDFAGATSATASSPDVAGMLLDFIAGNRVADVIRSKGMEPWSVDRGKR